MSRILVLLLGLVLATPVQAINLTCTVPNALVTRSQELCEELRLMLHVRTSEWSNNVCATQMLRIGLFEFNKESARREGSEAAAVVIAGIVDAYEPGWAPLTPARCGDGVLDVEFGEACDDNNLSNGDGCNSSCEVE